MSHTAHLCATMIFTSCTLRRTRSQSIPDEVPYPTIVELDPTIAGVETQMKSMITLCTVYSKHSKGLSAYKFVFVDYIESYTVHMYAYIIYLNILSRYIHIYICIEMYRYA